MMIGRWLPSETGPFSGGYVKLRGLSHRTLGNKGETESTAPWITPKKSVGIQYPPISYIASIKNLEQSRVNIDNTSPKYIHTYIYMKTICWISLSKSYTKYRCVAAAGRPLNGCLKNTAKGWPKGGNLRNGNTGTQGLVLNLRTFDAPTPI